MVVVNKGTTSAAGIERDPEILKLQVTLTIFMKLVIS
jgi:hypothetical protein